MRTQGALGMLASISLLASTALVSADGTSAELPDLKSPLALVADVPLGGRTTRLDYESLDPGRHLLFIAHLGDSAVVVFDTKEQRVIKRIQEISKVHGVLAIPELGRVYASVRPR